MKKIITIACSVGLGALVFQVMNMYSTSCCRRSAITRSAAHAINPLFLQRSSDYILSGESISDEQLKSLFEAARWAPSAYNGQPWRFIYAKRGSQEWQTFLDLMVDFNKAWAQHAAVLVVIVSQNNFEHNNQPSRTHSFDTGAAWQNLALQAAHQGLVAHGMSGFDFDRAAHALNVPQGYSVEAMVAIGYPGDASSANEQLQGLQKRAESPARKHVEQIAFEGKMN